MSCSIQPMIRLTFIRVLAAVAMLSAGAAASGSPAGIGADFKGPVGLQLYSLRAQFGKDVPGTLAEVRAFGIQYGELAGSYGLTPEQFKAQLDQHGIEAVSGHFSVRAVPG